MIELIETLKALEKNQTMVKTSTYLRLTQSTISKRIASLEYKTGLKLVKKIGRNVFLTEEAKVLLEKSQYHILSLKKILNEDYGDYQSIVNIGFSESILASFGANVLSNEMMKDYSIRPHAHRSPVVIDRVRSGEYILGVCAGYCIKAPDLFVSEIGFEKLMLVGDKKIKRFMTIEESSETWQSIQSQCKKEKLNFDLRLESFSSIAGLVNSSFANGLIPKGMGVSMIHKDKQLKSLNIKRPIIMIARKSTYAREDLASLIKNLQSLLKQELKLVNSIKV